MTENPTDRSVVTEWELVERRIEVPHTLQEQALSSVQFMRVPRGVDEKLQAKHPDIMPIYEDLNTLIETWEAFRTRSEGRVEIYLGQNAKNDRAMLVCGYDRRGFFNLISMYVVRKRNWSNRELVWRAGT